MHGGFNNALKHAGTDAVVVDVVEAEGSIAVRVTDEGRGFDTASQVTGFRLANLP